MYPGLRRRIFSTDWSSDNRTALYLLNLSITRKCNLSCRMCGRRNFTPQWLRDDECLSTDELVRVVNDASALGVREVHIGCRVGEPMCEPDKAFAIMEAVKKRRMRGMIVTNGTLFSEEDLSRLVQIDWDVMIFSVYGANAGIHDSVTGTDGSFSATEGNIRKIVAEKRTGRNVRKKPYMVVAFVPNRLNYLNLIEMVHWGRQIGVDRIIVELLVVHHEKGREIAMGKGETEELVGLLKKARKIIGRNRMSNNFLEIEDFLTRQLSGNSDEKAERTEEKKEVSPSIFCYSPWIKMFVSSDGKVTPCATLADNVGESLKERNIREIWRGDFFASFRERMRQERHPEECRECPAQDAILMRREIRNVLTRRSRLPAGRHGIRKEECK